MGITMVIHIFDLVSKTTIQIYFKLDGDVPWVGLHQVCSNSRVTIIFLFFMIFFVFLILKILKNGAAIKLIDIIS